MMDHSIISWNQHALSRRIRRFTGVNTSDCSEGLLRLLSGCYDHTLKEMPVEYDIFDKKVIIDYENDCRYFFNKSKFATQCDYTLLKLFYKDEDVFEPLDAGVKVTYSCPEDDFMLMTLEHGQNFFYRAD